MRYSVLSQTLSCVVAFYRDIFWNLVSDILEVCKVQLLNKQNENVIDDNIIY